MTNMSPWLAMLIGFILGLCVVGLIAYASGPEHYRGDEPGTHGTKIIVIRPAQ